jgi:hypothetical protein
LTVGRWHPTAAHSVRLEVQVRERAHARFASVSTVEAKVVGPGRLPNVENSASEATGSRPLVAYVMHTGLRRLYYLRRTDSTCPIVVHGCNRYGLTFVSCYSIAQHSRDFESFLKSTSWFGSHARTCSPYAAIVVQSSRCFSFLVIFYRYTCTQLTGIDFPTTTVEKASRECPGVTTDTLSIVDVIGFQTIVDEDWKMHSGVHPAIFLWPCRSIPRGRAFFGGCRRSPRACCRRQGTRILGQSFSWATIGEMPVSFARRLSRKFCWPREYPSSAVCWNSLTVPRPTSAARARLLIFGMTTHSVEQPCLRHVGSGPNWNE